MRIRKLGIERNWTIEHGNVNVIPSFFFIQKVVLFESSRDTAICIDAFDGFGQ
jgi:hypothetical protein